VYHLVDYQVFQLFGRFLGHFEVDPNAADPMIAGPPAGFHFLNPKLLHFYSHARFIPFNETGNLGPEIGSVEELDGAGYPILFGSWPDIDPEGGVAKFGR